MIQVTIKDVTDKDDIQILEITGRGLAGAFFSQPSTDLHTPVDALTFGDLTVGDYMSTASTFLSFAFEEWRRTGASDREFLALAEFMLIDSMKSLDSQELRKKAYQEDLNK